MRVTPFEKLHFAHVQGTSTLDGTQMVRVSLQRRNGRRESTIPRLIQEFNTLSGTDPIVPCLFVMTQRTTVQCFKATQQDNPIVLRIESDKMSGSSRYWSWDAEKEDKTQTSTKKSGFAGLEGLLRNDLNLDPSALCMQSAYDHVARAYFQVYGTELKNSGNFHTKDKDFLLSELRRHFDNERMYIVSPNTQSALTPAAKAILDDGCIMGDLSFAREEDGAQGSAPVPNATTIQYLKKMLSRHETEEVVTVSLRDVLSDFNHESEGFYRRTCIAPFMAPFIASGAVELVAGDTLRIHTLHVAKQIADL